MRDALLKLLEDVPDSITKLMSATTDVTPFLNDFCTAGVRASGQRTSIEPPLPKLEAPFLTSVNEASFILPNSSWNTFSGSKRHLC